VKGLAELEELGLGGGNYRCRIRESSGSSRGSRRARRWNWRKWQFLQRRPPPVCASPAHHFSLVLAGFSVPPARVHPAGKGQSKEATDWPAPANGQRLQRLSSHL